MFNANYNIPTKSPLWSTKTTYDLTVLRDELIDDILSACSNLTKPDTYIESCFFHRISCINRLVFERCQFNKNMVRAFFVINDSNGQKYPMCSFRLSVNYIGDHEFSVSLLAIRSKIVGEPVFLESPPITFTKLPQFIFTEGAEWIKSVITSTLVDDGVETNV